jgi:hypothetical protein
MTLTVPVVDLCGRGVEVKWMLKGIFVEIWEESGVDSAGSVQGPVASFGNAVVNLLVS